MILQSKDIDNNVFIHNELTQTLEDKILIKNNLIYITDKVDLTFINKTKSVLSHSNEYLYYLINNSKEIYLTNKIKLKDDLYKEEIDFNDLDEFTFREKGFFPKGNLIALYFSSPIVKNPLNVIFQIVSTVSLDKEYHDVKIDYILFKQKIVYFILFRYSLEIERNYSEILKVKEDILKLERFLFDETIFPEVQIRFQQEHLNQFEDINRIEEGLTYEGSSVFTPF